MAVPSNNPFENTLKTALRQRPEVPTPECLSEETLWEYVEQGGSYPAAADIARHMMHCAFCLEGYSQMIQIRELSLAAQTGIIPNPQQEMTTEPLPSFRQWLRGRMSLQWRAALSFGTMCGLLLIFAGGFYLASFSSLARSHPSEPESDKTQARLREELRQTRTQATQLQEQLSQQEINAKNWTAKAQSLEEKLAQERKRKPLRQIVRATPYNETLTPDQKAFMLPDLPGSSGGGGTFRSLILEEPLPGFVVATTPVLRWKSLPDAAQYEVHLTDEDNNNFTSHLEGYQKTEEKGKALVSENVCRVVKPLPRGKAFRWRVEASNKEGEQFAEGSGGFVIASKPLATAVARRSLQAGKESEQAGLFDEAHAHYRRVPPDIQPLYKEAQNRLKIPH